MSIERTHKKCKDCKKRKSIKEFYVSRLYKGTTYHSSYCKGCSVERSRKTDLRLKAKNYRRLWEYFETHPCVDCGEGNPLKLSADHRDEKNGDLADMMKSKWFRIAAELKLCDIRCHNCHAVKTAASRGHFATKSLRDYVTKWPENKKAYEEYQ